MALSVLFFAFWKSFSEEPYCHIQKHGIILYSILHVQYDMPGIQRGADINSCCTAKNMKQNKQYNSKRNSTDFFHVRDSETN